MENGVSRHVAARFRGLQRRHGDVGGHAVEKRPADHHAGAQVDHGRQVEPPLAGAQVGDVADELVGGDGAREVAAHQVGPGPGLGVGDGGALARVGRAAAYAQLAHQFQHPCSASGARTPAAASRARTGSRTCGPIPATRA